MAFKDIVNRLGTLRNELLVFAVMVTIILNGSAMALDRGGTEGYQKVGGLVMHFSTIPILLFFGAFYCYAYVRLPSSAQELTFTTHAKELISEDAKRRVTKRVRTSV